MADNVNTQDLARFSPLSSLSPDNLKELSRKARYVSVAAGRYLFRDGERSDAQLFLVKGTVELHGENGIEQTVEGGSEPTRNALDVIGPKARAARASTDTVALAVDRDLLDLMLTWDQTGSYRVEELADAGEEDDGDWMTRLLQTECFRRIPPANIQAIFMRMEPVGYNAGDVVIRQGESGDYFYIIREGRCLVTRATKAKPDGIRLAELGQGDSFGEEALISDKERNATVTMLTSGTLMRMSKEDFNSLLTEPLIERLDFESASDVVAHGAGWIDVRLPAEFENGHIQSATNVPLFVLRMKAQKLDPARTWVLYCDTGRRSSAAAFILSERGFDVRVLNNGLAGVPPEAIATETSAQ
ncbi:cyclic nucleotide-binding domain-containing protein [Halofilum ochraceum]|uniref:cyclic nucleotide-binding domain-containing protein n=1 Tax=Halofilum ochraceum TaxID=1611323 RepID=UPI0008D9D591|nr:cyclic nucleotide-binding domain-containing protein [Halofilum ochraceum]